MDDPALPPDFNRRIASLEQRIRVLETANRLQASSVRGGAFQVLDDDGNEVAKIGRLQATPFAVDGLYVNSQTGVGAHLYVGDNTGVAIPWIDHAWFDPADTIAVTSGSFVETWRSMFELATSYVLKFRVYVDVPAATTAELRVIDGAGTQIGGDKSVAGASAAYHEFSCVTAIVPQTGPITVKLMARRTAGAGTVQVYVPSGAAMGALGMGPDADGWV